jgi:hypothetical protein
MLNFLLEKNKKLVTIEYFLRVFIYFLLFTFFSLIVLISLFLPSIFYSKYQNSNVSSQLLSIKGEVGEKSDDPIEIIKAINKFTEVFVNENEMNKVQFSYLINKIISLKNKNIKISSFSVAKDVNNTIKIVLNGVSGSRDSLTSFDKDIKKEKYFQSVELPVSYLIKNIDADFTMILIYKNQDAK